MTHHGPSALLKGSAVSAFVLVSVATVLQFAGLRVNASASLPMGLYKITSDFSEKLVAFCPPEPFASLSAGRGYRRRGSCPDGFEPLMKPVVATSGDVVDLSVNGIAINGRRVPNSAPEPFDTKGRPLTHWPSGKYRVGSDAMWVVSSFNVRSFDSRYFGPIPLCSIRSHLRPLLTECCSTYFVRLKR
jgi:conjugative transfer signal peptidase TraF